MNILFFTPVNFRCRDIESLAERFMINGHRVFLLSQCPEGPLHESARRFGVETHIMATTGNSIGSILRRGSELIKFCRRNNIDVCFSHLEPTNFVSVLVQYFLRTRFILYRHHISEARLSGFDRTLAYRLTYKLGRTIVCVSKQAKQYMIDVEHVPQRRIIHINLGYNFSLYDVPDKATVARIRNGLPNGIVLLFAGRLTKFKRPSLCVEIVKRALAENIPCSVLIVGAGDEEAPTRALAEMYSIQDRVLFVGFSHQILEYMAAADLLIHPSLMESSCVVVKEASLVGLPVVVCKGVGDFDDYLESNKNSVVISKENFFEESLTVLRDYQLNSSRYRQMGLNLRADIVSRFNIDNVIGQYDRLIGT